MERRDRSNDDYSLAFNGKRHIFKHVSTVENKTFLSITINMHGIIYLSYVPPVQWDTRAFEYFMLGASQFIKMSSLNRFIKTT